jgi:hypothetical protein
MAGHNNTASALPLLRGYKVGNPHSKVRPGHVCCGSWSVEWQRWQRSVAIVRAYYRSVLSSGRARHKRNDQCPTVIKIFVGPRSVADTKRDRPSDRRSQNNCNFNSYPENLSNGNLEAPAFRVVPLSLPLHFNCSRRPCQARHWYVPSRPGLTIPLLWGDTSESYQFSRNVVRL